MKKIVNIVLIINILIINFILPLSKIEGYEVWSAYTVISNSQTVRSTPAFGNNQIEEIPPYISFRVIGESGDFLKIVYGDNNREGYVFNGKDSAIRRSSDFKEDKYGRPWTTPAKSIIGGSKIIAESYINVGQFTSYLKKFQVNPNYKLYDHQYMTNIRAPWSEARTAYKAYSNYLAEVSFTFSIPVYNNMPDSTTLSGMSNKGSFMSAADLNDANFETYLTNQGFPESYKGYLRSLHKTYPNWIFKSLKTNLDFNSAVSNEIPKSCIETSTGHGTNYGCGNESAAWAKADDASVRYFMDPRNFLDKESIFMFEDLSSYSNVTESMVQRILNGTFMSGKSSLDNKNYATIFMQAGQQNKVNPVYLASLVVQEVGTNGSIQTSGGTIEWYGIRYKSLYNFFDIGASGTFTAKGGIVWASGGSPNVFEFINKIDGYNNTQIQAPTNLDSYITSAGYSVNNSYIGNVKEKVTVGTLKSKINGATIKITNSSGTELSSNSLIGTGCILTISKDGTSYSKTIIVTGDVDGDGEISATDYVGIKNHIMDVKKFSTASTKGADMNNNALVDAGDYVAIKNYIMSR